jgi:hypothetical protein
VLLLCPGKQNCVPNYKNANGFVKDPKSKRKKTEENSSKQFKGSHSKNLIGHIAFFSPSLFHT